jgi:hypothetical protein
LGGGGACDSAVTQPRSVYYFCDGTGAPHAEDGHGVVADMTLPDSHRVQALSDGARYARDAIGGATDMWREGGWMRIAQVSIDAAAQGWQSPHSDACLLMYLRPLMRRKARGNYETDNLVWEQSINPVNHT